jgi:hypothetical protein
MTAARALTAEDRPPSALLDAEELRRQLALMLPDLTTSSGPPSKLEPPLSAAECKYLMGEATPEEAAEAQAQFDKRADTSPDGEFWTCGVPDEDDA